MQNSTSCVICKQPSSEKFVNGNNPLEYHFRVNCQKCGEYLISGSEHNVKQHSDFAPDQIRNARRWIYENPKGEITTQAIEKEFIDQIKFSVAERAENLFLEMARKNKKIGDIINVENTDIYPWLGASSSVDGNEVQYLIQYLIKKVWLKSLAQTNIIVMITPEGYEYLDLRLRGNSDGISGFCAMWFDEGILRQLGPPIKNAVELAGYKFIRIDKVDHNNKIDDEIIANIRRSKFVVADFTGQRGGVYFKAGFALGLGKQVIWTIKKGDFDKIHFDNRQYNFIDWSEEKLEEFQTRLQNRIEATVGHGPLK